MKTWLMSLTGAITLSVIAFVTNLQMLVLVAVFDPDFKTFWVLETNPGR